MTSGARCLDLANGWRAIVGRDFYVVTSTYFRTATVVPDPCQIGRENARQRGQRGSVAVKRKTGADEGFHRNFLVEVSGLEPPTSTLRT